MSEDKNVQETIREAQAMMEAAAAAEKHLSTTQTSDLEATLQEAQRRAAMYEETIPPVPEQVTGTPSLREKAQELIDTVKMIGSDEMLFKMLQGGDDITKILALYMMMADMQDRRLLRMMQMRMLMGQTNNGITPDQIRRIIEEELNRRLEGREERGSRVSEIKEMLELVKVLKPSESRDVEELKQKIERLENEQLLKKIEDLEKRLSERSEMSDVEKAIELYRKLKEIFGEKKEESSNTMTTTISPLGYRGTAPWFLHPDTREAIKDLVVTTIGAIGEVFKTYYALKNNVPIRGAQTTTTTISTEEELPRIGV